MRWLSSLALGLCATAAQAQPTCTPDPLAGRTLYLRGSFNSWNAVETQKFTWACDRWELVTKLNGEHVFKIADEGWSADADFGQGSDNTLKLRGSELRRRFDGVQRFSFKLNGGQPALRVEACPAPAPLGDTVLYLRGTLNNWAALDEFAFRYSCDAYYLNIKASDRQEFKVADAAWKDATSFGVNGGNFVQTFDGEHTLRLAFDAGKPVLTVGPRTFADPVALSVSDPVALSLRFDSRALAHKRPFGAVPTGTTVSYAVDAAPGVDALTLVVEKRRLEGNQEVLDYTEVARVPMLRDGARWTAQHRYADVAVHGMWFEAQIAGKRYALQNNTDAVFWTREKGSGGVAAVADLPASTRSLRRFRQTVYSPSFKVPAWAPDIVYYVVFPDRFRNGDKRNDPRPGRDRYHQHTVEFHSDWNQRPYRPGVIDGKSDGSDAHHNNDFYGGDLAGLIDKLDHIKDLGANTIYMTPIFRAASNHKYDTADYRNIDPAFGTNADFTRLTREAAKRGMRVIPDTSLNHTGADSVYFNRYGNFGTQGAFQNGRINPASPYAGWYSFDATQTDADRQFKGWVGVTDLPELNKNSPALRDFFYRDPGAVMKLWLDRGASGWRMDVAPWVPDDFWREWRTAIKQHKPDALTIAETWFDASKYLLGDMFDSTMNYIFRNVVLDYAAGGRADTLYPNIELMREAYPPQAFYALMNLLSSHDQARALHHFGWRHDKDGATADAATIALAKRRLKLAVLFQMIFPGAPSVYYGDEVGVTGGDDPDNRATYPWPDLGGQPDLALRAEFKKLIGLRHRHAVLRRGSIAAPLHVDAHVVVLARRLGSTWAITATNNADTARRVSVALPPGMPAAALRDVLNRDASFTPAEGRLSFDVPPLYGRALVTP